mgnify:FL=1
MDCKKFGRIKEGIVSKAFIKVVAMPDMVFLSVDSYLITRVLRLQPYYSQQNENAPKACEPLSY